MTFKLICLLTFTVFANTCFAQKDPDVTNVTKVTILNPGLSYETRVAKFQTIYGQVFGNTSAYFSSSSTFGTDYGIYFDPAVTVQYRYYYNGYRRMEREKRTEMNSMNYVSFVSEFMASKAALTDDYFDEDSRRLISRFGIAWGLQRNYRGRFSLDLNLGFGYLISKGTRSSNGQTTSRTITMPTSMGQLTLGIWLNKRKVEED
jgi:hypothetical protein